MSNNGLGDITTPDARTITVEANSAISAGDALAIKQDATEGRLPVVEPLQDDSSPNIDQEAGVATEDISSGANGTMCVSGGIIANVASGVAQGERLGASTTAGQYASEDDGPIVALSGEGETDRAGTSLSANEAEVLI